MRPNKLLGMLTNVDSHAQKEKKMVSELIRKTDVTRLAPPLNETDLLQQLVSWPTQVPAVLSF